MVDIVSDNPVIQQWYETYTKYARYFEPDATEAEIQNRWCQRTNDLIEYFHETQNVWHNDPVGFIKCYTDYYKRQCEHLEYVGFKQQIIPHNTGGRYWR